MKILSLEKKEDGNCEIDIEFTEEEQLHYNKLMEETGKTLDELISTDEVANILIEQYKNTIEQ